MTREERLDKVMRFVLNASREEIEKSITDAEYVGSQAAGLGSHFAAKFRSHIPDDECGLMYAYALVRSMFAWSPHYVRDWQRSLIGEESDEWNLFLNWMYNYMGHDIGIATGNVLMDNALEMWQREMKDAYDYGSVRSILKVIQLMPEDYRMKLWNFCFNRKQ